MKKAIGFILATMTAGFLSGILHPVFWIRGAVIGGALAVGLLICHRHYRNNGCRMSIWRIHGIIFAVAVAACAVIVLLTICLHSPVWNRDELLDNSLWRVDSLEQVSKLFTSCFILAWGILFCDRSYCLDQGKKFLYFFVVPSLSVIPRFASDLRDSDFFMFYAVLGVPPFLLLWGGVAKMFGFFREVTYEEFYLAARRRRKKQSVIGEAHE